MTYRGQVRNGKVLLADDVTLPEGAEVEVAVVRVPKSGNELHLGSSIRPPTGWNENEPARISVGDPPVSQTLVEDRR